MRLKKKQSAIEALYANVIKEIGADKEPDFLDLKNTPKRVASSLVNEILRGYSMSELDLIKQLRMFSSEGMQALVVQSHTPFVSLCAHHMLPFTGTATIGYLPGPKLVGLSKLVRILDFYSARLQIQERLGMQVADFLIEEVEASAAFVVLKAEHHCMSARGVRKHGVQTITAAIRPIPPDPVLLSEFYRLASL
jgi:GTP cyclohydrolase I